LLAHLVALLLAEMQTTVAIIQIMRLEFLLSDLVGAAAVAGLELMGALGALAGSPHLAEVEEVQPRQEQTLEPVETEVLDWQSLQPTSNQ
jgi:hypothetical protein